MGSWLCSRRWQGPQQRAGELRSEAQSSTLSGQTRDCFCSLFAATRPVGGEGAERLPARSSMNCEANRNGKVSRTKLIAAVLQADPRMTVQEIIAAHNQEFAWKCTASNLTGHLYTNPNMFTHIGGRTRRQESGRVVAQVGAMRESPARVTRLRTCSALRCGNHF